MITTREEYDYCLSRGYDPLWKHWKILPMSNALRREIQKEKFGRNDAEGNERYYRYCLRNKPLVCEECGMPIRHPSAYNVSHILTKGAHPDMSHDPRNCNILCPRHHNQWEDNTTRVTMKIYKPNQSLIEQLKNEYNEN